MVNTYLLLTLFKKAKSERLKRDLERNRECPFGTSQQGISHNKCRICLKEGTIPIYNYQGHDMSADICTFGDIDISKDDKSLHFICDPCHKLLQAAILFRKTAKISDQKNTLARDKKLFIEAQVPLTQTKIEKTPETSKLVPQNFFSTVPSDIGDTHQKQMKKIAKVRCGVCHKVITKAYYKEHLALHNHTVTKYVCDVCGKSFRQRCSYRAHYLIHSSVFPYKCNLCLYRGRRLWLLKSHMRIHTEDYTHLCTECPARFLTKSNLNKHSLTHKEPLFKCDSCQRRFHSKLNLERHFEVVHLGIKNNICNVCGKAFGYRKAMMRHQLDVHKREKRVNGRTPAYIEAELKSSDS